MDLRSTLLPTPTSWPPNTVSEVVAPASADLGATGAGGSGAPSPLGSPEELVVSVVVGWLGGCPWGFCPVPCPVPKAEPPGGDAPKPTPAPAPVPPAAAFPSPPPATGNATIPMGS